MCDFELVFKDVENKFDIDFSDYFKTELKEIEPLAGDNLLSLSSGRLVISDLGRILIRNIAMVFDKYLRNSEKEMRFSKTV